MRAFIICVVVCALSACASAPTRHAAVILESELGVYEREVARKISAEKTFYRDQEKTLQDAAVRALELSQILARSNVIGRYVDEAMTPASGFSPTKMGDMLRAVSQKDQEYFEMVDTSKAAARDAAKLSVKQLSIKRDEIANAREALADLGREPSDKERAARLFEFAKKTKEELDKIRKTESTQPAATTP